MSSSNTENTPSLPPPPYGWIMEVDPRTSHPYYVSTSDKTSLSQLLAHVSSTFLDAQVDTKATPPRAIWVHPYEDEQYLSEHPEVRQKIEKAMKQHMPEDTDSDGHGMPSADERRHSYSAGSSSTSTRPGPTSGTPRPASTDSLEQTGKGKEKRGFFGKMKDKAIGTKEEREAYKREKARVCSLWLHSPEGGVLMSFALQVDEERRKAYVEAVKRQQAEYQKRQAEYDRQYGGRRTGYNTAYGPPQGTPGYGSSAFAPGNRYGSYGGRYGGGGYGYSGYDNGYGRSGYGNSYGNGYGRSGGGFGGAGLPILGGLAGGLLLGDLLSGGF